MEIVRKIQKLLRSKKAYSSAPLAVVIALAGMMFFVVLWQIIRLITISAGVKDAVQSAVIATSVGNYSNVYDGVREGYSGGYRFSGNSWRAAGVSGDVLGPCLRATFTDGWINCSDCTAAAESTSRLTLTERNMQSTDFP